MRGVQELTNDNKSPEHYSPEIDNICDHFNAVVRRLEIILLPVVITA